MMSERPSHRHRGSHTHSFLLDDPLPKIGTRIVSVNFQEGTALNDIAMLCVSITGACLVTTASGNRNPCTEAYLSSAKSLIYMLTIYIHPNVETISYPEC